jgi:predicted secreted protein
MTVGSRNTLTLSGPSLGQIRVRVAPSVAGQALNFTHMGIGKWDGTANKSNTTAAPIEVTFNGGHGLTINPGGASVWSDWINVSSLSLNTGDKVVICTDEATNCGYRTSFNNSNATSAYSSLPTWNDATADNVDQSGSWVFGIAEIQTLGAVTVFTPTTPLNTNNNDPNTGLRVVVSVTAAVVSQLRIQFQPNQAGQPATDIANMGVGKWAGNLGDTTATPIRVTWNNGQPGLSVAAGTPAIWSDWIDVSSLSVVAGQQLVITMDNGPSGGYYSSTGNTNVLCFLTSVPSWN